MPTNHLDQILRSTIHSKILNFTLNHYRNHNVSPTSRCQKSKQLLQRDCPKKGKKKQNTSFLYHDFTARSCGPYFTEVKILGQDEVAAPEDLLAAADAALITSFKGGRIWKRFGAEDIGICKELILKVWITSFVEMKV